MILFLNIFFVSVRNVHLSLQNVEMFVCVCLENALNEWWAEMVGTDLGRIVDACEKVGKIDSS